MTWKRHKNGQKGVPGKGKSELKKVLKVLNKTPNSMDTGDGLVNLSLKGKVSTKKLPDLATSCFNDNFSVFDDAVGIRDDFVCTGNQVGGVLASGGSCRTINAIGQWKEESLFAAGSGRVIFNAYTDCYYRGDFPFGGAPPARSSPRSQCTSYCTRSAFFTPAATPTARNVPRAILWTTPR